MYGGPSWGSQRGGREGERGGRIKGKKANGKGMREERCGEIDEMKGD